MKNIFTLLKISVLALIAMSVFSCKKDEVKTVPTVSVEFVSSGMTSATLSITSENANELAYMMLNDAAEVPSARGILTAGTKIQVPGGDVTVSDLVAGETYHIAAAAVSENGEYSEVATLEFGTSGQNCSFDIDVISATDKSISYSVVPSMDNVDYYVAALEFSVYGDSDDEAIYEAVAESAAQAASAAGISLQEYLSQNLHRGEYSGVVSELVPETEYLLTVFGMSSEDASPTTPLSRIETSTVPETPELTFDLEYSDVTTTTVHLKVTPSNKTAQFIFLCLPSANFPDLTEDDADEIAQRYVDGVKSYLDAGIGLYTGDQDVPNFSIMQNTEYYFFAFGYTPGVGISSKCELVSFMSERGVVPEDFEAEIIIDATTAKRISARVVPAAGFESIFYGCVAIPTDEYTEELAKESVEQAIVDYYNQQVEFNPTYSMLDAVTAVCDRGEGWFEPSGLTPETEYTVAAVSVSNEGIAAKVLTATATTGSEDVSAATFTSTFVKVYDGNEALEAGLFADSPHLVKDKGIAVFHFERSSEAVECYYFMANGDYSNPDEEYKTDDDLLSWITTNPYFYQADENTHYAFVSVDFYDAYTYLGWYYTMLTVAKDSQGMWGPVGRTMILPEYAKRGDIQELVDLINEIEAGTESLSIKASK